MILKARLDPDRIAADVAVFPLTYGVPLERRSALREVDAQGLAANLWHASLGICRTQKEELMPLRGAISRC